MTGETNLTQLLKSMNPVLHQGEYVFCTFPDFPASIALDEIICLVREDEGISIVLKRLTADRLALDYSFVAAWITLTVNSSLNAVGLTAIFSAALANERISCNVVAGYYHDHIFVPVADADKALDILSRLADWQ